MPTILRWKGFRFHFFSADGVEPPHVHVDKDNYSAKFWLTPEIKLAKNRGFSDNELNQLHRKIEDERDTLLDAWQNYFGE